MANERGKSIDNTHLSIDQAEERGFIHRDYIAHCMRWTHVMKWLNEHGRWRKARIMDIGCGVDLPLAKMLYSSRFIVESYIGVDYNRPDKFKMAPFHTGKFPIEAYGNIDFANYDHVGKVEVASESDSNMVATIKVGNDYHPIPNVWVCFEMLEHIEPEHVRRVLQKVHRQMVLSKEAGNDPTFFMSTPNYDPNVGAAANHVNEMKHAALNYVLEDMGFHIEAEFGTFASKRDINHLFAKNWEYTGELLLQALGEYYDSNYMATILAPLYPAEARNCLRRLKVANASRENSRYYLNVNLEAIKPWSSSSLWSDLIPTLTTNETGPELPTVPPSSITTNESGSADTNPSLKGSDT